MLKHIASAAIAASVLMSSSAVMANDWFVGATVGSANHGFKADEDGDKPKFKDTYTGLRAGTFINDNIRVYANLGQVKGTDKESIGPVSLTGKIKNQELSVSADYVDNLLQLENTKYFVGGTLGYNRMKLDLDIEEGNDKLSASGKDNAALYGVQFGLIQEFTPSISAELGYRYSRMNNKVNLNNPDFDEPVEFKQKDQKLAYINVSYRF
ncbi:outer membrane beta-barrel protein [Endozoicomonas sp.]|uniref:outer membrane beta-barrel protein n=1 Tax=Endozoicomonas sp. TaxID=1892382 RepID=UPI003AF451F3